MKYLLVSILFIEISSVAFSQAESTLFSNVINSSRQYFPQCKQCLIHENDSDAISKIEFLDHDFQTKVLSKGKNVKYWYCDIKSIDSGRVNIGVVSLKLNEKNVAVFKSKLKALCRKNFKLKALTHFKPLRLGNEVLILYSETFRKPDVKMFFLKFDEYSL